MPDNRLQLGYGSAWHVLRCLGWRRDQFTNHVAQSIGLPSIDWLDFRAGGGGDGQRCEHRVKQHLDSFSSVQRLRFQCG